MITIPLPAKRTTPTTPSANAPRAVPVPESDRYPLSKARPIADEEMPPLWVLLVLPLALAAVTIWWSARRLLRALRAF